MNTQPTYSPTRHTIFDHSGVYVPKVYDEVVIFRRSRTPDVWVGVQVDTPQNAAKFSNVTVLDGQGEPVDYLQQKGR